MKANEVRIGNMIQQVDTAFNVNADWCDIKYLSEGKRKYVGIPLTEDWLLKFGLLPKKYWKGVYGVNGYSLDVSSNVFQPVFMANGDDPQEMGEPLKYVHQLQNHYFALTGQELEIKEKV